MRALWLTDFSPQTGQITGGVEARCYFVRNYLEKAGVEVSLIGRHGAHRWRPGAWSTIPERLIFTVNTFLVALGQNFDLIEGTNFATYPIAYLVGSLRRKPVIFWYPDVFIGNWVKNLGWVGAVGELAERLFLRLPGVEYIAISDSTRSKLIKFGVAAENIRVIGCGVEESEIASVRVKARDKKYDISLVSRLVSYKHLENLLSAIGLLTPEFPRLSVAIVGQGPEKSHLVARAKSLGIFDRVHFLGYLPDHLEVLAVIRSSKIFCHPSQVEGFGIVIIESAALGIPFVAAGIPAVTEITQGGQGGLLFDPVKPGSLAKKIRQLLTDNDLYRRKSAEGQKLAQAYQWREIAGETIDFYESRLTH